MIPLVFPYVASVSLSMTPVVLILFAAASILGDRYAPRVRHMLWLAAAVRLLLPLELPRLGGFTVPVADPGYPLGRNTAEAIRTVAGAGTGQPVWQTVALTDMLSIVWMIGVAALLLYHFTAYYAALRGWRRWRVPVRSPGTLELFNRLKRELSISRRIGLYRCRAVSSPMLVGFFSPSILLPAEPIGEASLGYVLRHELLHYKRGDLWYKLLLLLLNCVHWFNPAVWLLARQAEAAMELACDGDVLRGADPKSRRGYGLTVLSFAESEGAKRYPLATSFGSGKSQLSRRLAAVMSPSVGKRGFLPLGVAIAVIAIGGTLIAFRVKPADPGSEVRLEEAAAIDPALLDWLRLFEHELYAGYYRDERYQVYVQTTDIDLFRQLPEVQAAIDKGWEFELVKAAYSFGDLERAAARLEAAAEELGLGAIDYYNPDNGLRVQTRDISEENRRKIQDAAGIENITLHGSTINGVPPPR